MQQAQHRLDEWRVKRGYSRRGLAKLFNKKFENTLRYYTADYDPKLSTLEFWAEKLHIRVVDLLPKHCLRLPKK